MGKQRAGKGGVVAASVGLSMQWGGGVGAKGGGGHGRHNGSGVQA